MKTEDQKPLIHFRPEKNWINDPNGVCQVNGVYHLFHQYNPHGSTWGDMHWGHAVSRDMYHWEPRSIAMIPEESKGEIHCFSGSCCKDPEGKPHFFYTSIGREEDGRDCTDGAQQWYAEPSDGEMTRLIQTNEQALTDDIHGGIHVRDWRDPCVIPYEKGYLMVLGGRLEGKGCILLYSSSDMRNWTYRHVLLQADVADDIPWECPNLFMLDGKAVVFWSPCAAVQYAVGTLDEDLRLKVERTGVLDPAGRHGYYAPQVFRDEQDRMILIGWMPEDDGDAAAIGRGWSGVMSLPRLLSIRNGDLRADPLPGWESLVKDREELKADQWTETGRHFILHGKLPDGNIPWKLTFQTSGGEKFVLGMDAEGMLALDRERSSSCPETDRSLICRKVVREENGEFFLCVDGTAIECIAFGQCLSGRIYLSGGEDGMILPEGGISETVLNRIGRW